MLRRHRHAWDLIEKPEAIDLVEVAFGRHNDPEATVPYRLDEAIVEEVEQRFSNGSRGDAELVREVAHRVDGTGLELPGDDARSDCCCRTFPEVRGRKAGKRWTSQVGH